APASLGVRGAEGVERVRGRGWVREEVLVAGELRGFRVSGAGFWQVHPGAAQALLDAVLATTRPAPGERALDLYCGVGLFAGGLARLPARRAAGLRPVPHDAPRGVRRDARSGVRVAGRPAPLFPPRPGRAGDTRGRRPGVVPSRGTEVS